VWDAETGQRLLELTGHQGWVSSVAYGPGGRRIASVAADGTVVVWDAESGERLHVLAGHQTEGRSVAYSPGGLRIVSGADDGTVAVWDAQTGERLAALALDGPIASVAWHPDGGSLAAGSGGGDVYRLDYREP
jgi:WD40 repeat protein